MPHTFNVGLLNASYQSHWGRRATHLLLQKLRGEPITLADDCPYAECVSFVQWKRRGNSCFQTDRKCNYTPLRRLENNFAAVWKHQYNIARARTHTLHSFEWQVMFQQRRAQYDWGVDVARRGGRGLFHFKHITTRCVQNYRLDIGVCKMLCNNCALKMNVTRPVY